VFRSVLWLVCSCHPLAQDVQRRERLQSTLFSVEYKAVEAVGAVETRKTGLKSCAPIGWAVERSASCGWPRRKFGRTGTHRNSRRDFCTKRKQVIRRIPNAFTQAHGAAERIARSHFVMLGWPRLSFLSVELEAQVQIKRRGARSVERLQRIGHSVEREISAQPRAHVRH